MSEDIVENLKQPSQWLRLIFMLGFIVVLYVAGLVLLAITLAQALFSLLTTRDNTNLREFGASLNCYVFDILQFITYNSQEKPFPFAPFPLAGSATSAAPTYRQAAPVDPDIGPVSPGQHARTGSTKSATKKTGSVRSGASKTKPAKPAGVKTTSAKSAAGKTSSARKTGTRKTSTASIKPGADSKDSGDKSVPE